MMLTVLVSEPKQPSDRIDVYLRPLVDDLKILCKPGVPEVWDEYKHEEFTMHGMLFTTIKDNPSHRNLSSQSKKKCSLSTLLGRYLCNMAKTFKTYLWGTVVSSARNIRIEPWIVSLMEKMRIKRHRCM
jgi:hypothetical protein